MSVGFSINRHCLSESIWPRSPPFFCWTGKELDTHFLVRITDLRVEKSQAGVWYWIKL